MKKSKQYRKENVKREQCEQHYKQIWLSTYYSLFFNHTYQIHKAWMSNKEWRTEEWWRSWLCSDYKIQRFPQWK